MITAYGTVDRAVEAMKEGATAGNGAAAAKLLGLESNYLLKLKSLQIEWPLNVRVRGFQRSKGLKLNLSLNLNLAAC